MPDPVNPLQILENIPEGVFATSRDCRITYFNQKAEEITGCNRERAVGKKCFQVFRAEICESPCFIKQSMETGRESSDQLVHVLDGASRALPIRIQTSPLRDDAGKIVGGLQTFQVVDKPSAEVRADLILFELTKKMGRGPALARLFENLPDLAMSDAPVLLQGEPGTGKRMMADAIHRLSARASGPYFHIHCRQAAPEALSRELLGSNEDEDGEPGSRRPGILEKAHRGTVFLERIGALPYSLQSNLFRAMEEGFYHPVGADTHVSTDIRLIASAETDLESKVRMGAFRENLFYCLNVFRLSLPPLRERPEDIPALARDMLWGLSLVHGKEIADLDDETARILQSHSFPGNLAELRDILSEAFTRAHGPVLRPGDLPPLPQPAVNGRGASAAPPSSDLREPSAGERERILQVLIRNHWNRTLAAQDLGMDRTTLWRKMKRMGIQAVPSRPREEEEA